MIRRIFIMLAILLLGGYIVVALMYFTYPSDYVVCRQVEWKIQAALHQDIFVSAEEMETTLRQKQLYPQDKLMNQISSRQIEECLAENPLIANVECYKTPTGSVCIEVVQRTPILRIMADNGEQYYLDEQGDIMPIGSSMAHLAVVTGAVTQQTVRDMVYDLGCYMADNSFWNNQIEQIHITPQQELELVPRVGDHIIFLGKPEEIPEKLEKLKIFYMKALNTVGWNKYSRISVEFTNQIICTKKEK